MRLLDTGLIRQAAGVGIKFSVEDPSGLAKNMRQQPFEHRADFKALTGYVLRSQPRRLDDLIGAFRQGEAGATIPRYTGTDIVQRRRDVVNYCLDMSDLDEPSAGALMAFFDRHDPHSDLHERLFGWLKNLPLCALPEHLQLITGTLQHDSRHGEGRYSRLLRILLQNAVDLQSYHHKDRDGVIFYYLTAENKLILILDDHTLLNEDNAVVGRCRKFLSEYGPEGEIMLSLPWTGRGEPSQTVSTVLGTLRVVWDYTPVTSDTAKGPVKSP